MFGIGGFELFLILLFGFLIFGPDKLPAIAKTIGKAIAKFRDTQAEMSESLKQQSFIDKDSDEPFKNPLEVIENASKNAKEGVKNARTKADDITDSITSNVNEIASDKASETEQVSSVASINSQKDRSVGFAERKAEYDRARKAKKEAEQKEKALRDKKLADEAKKAEEKKANPKNQVSKKVISDASDEEVD